MHPPVEPFVSGLLDVGPAAAGGRQRVWWEECGDPGGPVALALHGGPGSGCSPGTRRFFDPRWRAVLVDQRGCGRSRPSASDPATSLADNTTAHLVADLEAVREHRGIDRWVVFGTSWGSTLALAYARAHPERVRGLVLADVTTTSREEVDWLSRGVGRFLPREGEALRDGVPPTERAGDLTAAYARLLASPEASVRERAARGWCAWEQALVSGDAGAGPGPAGGRRASRYDDPVFAFGFARLVTHYFSHAGFDDGRPLLGDTAHLAGVPGTLVHTRLDWQAPLEVAWRLHRAWPGSELIVVEGAGHTSRALGEAATAALDAALAW